MDTREMLLNAVHEHPRAVEKVTEPGVYAWWDRKGALLSFYPSDFPPVDEQLPLYVGIATTSLAARGAGMHLSTTRMSTLRRNLCALLVDELELTHYVELKPRAKFALAEPAESRLTSWIEEHLELTWAAHVQPAQVEARVVGSLLPPFNDKWAHGGPYWPHMAAARVRLRTAVAEVASRR
jgi:hypothetical protein